MQDVVKFIKENNIGKYETNYSIKKLTTYKVGGNTKILVFPKNVKKLVSLLKLLNSKNIKYKVIGNGSNLLFSDHDYNGVLIKLSEFDHIEIKGCNIKVGAGYSLIKLSHEATKKSLTGLEFAAGIPGTVGGSVFMNAGAYKSDMGYVVKSIKVLTPDFKVITLVNRELNFHYRTSFLQKHPNYICLEASIKLKKGKKEAIEQVIKDRLKRRLETQPLEYPSAGSVFRNPKDKFAGELIENLGLKGLYKGKAQVSEKHANFIVNTGGATASNIKELMELVKYAVKENYDIDLKIEQEMVNWE